MPSLLAHGYNKEARSGSVRTMPHLCCNGFRRVLVVGSLTGVDRRGADPLSGGVPYGYKWEPV